MTIQVNCTCGKKLRAKPELAGRRVKCPACGGVLVVPDPRSGLEPEPDGLPDLDSLTAADTGATMLPSEPLRPVTKKADASHTRLIIGLSAGAGGIVLVLLLALILWPSGNDDEQPVGGQQSAGNGAPGVVNASPENSVTGTGASVAAWPTVTDATRTYPSFPDAATEPPPWTGQGTPFDVAKFFEAPPFDENAAPLYLDALFEFSGEFSICFLPAGEQPQGEVLRRVEAARQRNDEYVRFEKTWEKDPKPVDEAAVDAWLAQYETGFQKLAHAQKRPQCMFETGVGVAALLPHTQARQIARIAKWRVRRDLAKGNIDRPIEDVLLVLRLSRDLQPRGHVICQLVSAAMDNLCCEEIITQILRADGIGQEHCDRLIGELTRHEVASQRRMTEGVRMEYLIARKTFHDFQHHMGDFSPQAMKDMGQPDSPLTCLKLLIDFSFSGQLVKEKYGNGAAGLTPDHPLVAFAAGWKHDGKLLSDADYANEVNALNTVYASILSNADRTLLEQVRASADPAIVEPLRATKVALFFEPTGGQNWQKAFLKTETTLRGTQCLIAMKRWQLDHDGPAPDLDTIVKAAGMKAVPLDPYTNQPMRTTTFMGRPVVYSIGPDGKDDRGQEAKWDSKSTNWQGDFPFRLNATR